MKTDNKTEFLSVIPFSGLYNSWHDESINHEIKMMFMDDHGIENDALSNRVFESCNFKALHSDYAKDYAEHFAHITGLRLHFDALKCPREYNFVTDRIFCTMNRNILTKLYIETDKDALKTICRESFTSCDGFMSYYDPDFKTWGLLSTWDHNQIGALLSAWMKTNGHDIEDIGYNIIESMSCNGRITQLIERHTPDIGKLYTISDYLRNKAA